MVERCGRCPIFEVRGALGCREAFEGEGGARLLLPLLFSLPVAMLESSVCSEGVSAAGVLVLVETRLRRLRAMPLLDRLWALLGEEEMSVDRRGRTLREEGDDMVEPVVRLHASA